MDQPGRFLVTVSVAIMLVLDTGYVPVFDCLVYHLGDMDECS